MRDRVILMVGLYDTLDIFTYELKKEFEKIGLEVMIFNSQDMEGSMIKLSEFIKEPVKAVVTFNNLGFNMELKKGENIWESLGIPCINILMDHPMFHKNALDAAPDNAIVICPDRNHMKFVQRFYPDIQIAGMISPPFRSLSREEEKAYIQQINDSGADIVWIGLGAPKQENWMYEHQGMLHGVMIGVGAGFSYHAGLIKRAPKWMQKMSLEWFYRLMQDPVRLFKRYFTTNLKFMLLEAKDKGEAL